MRARRSCLAVPGSSERMLAKAASLAADEIVIDLEDSVSPSAKEEARRLVCRFLSGSPREEVAVRINGLDTPWWRDDVVALIEAASDRIGSVVVPKAERAQDMTDVDALLGPTGIRLQALIETAAGLLHAGQIAAAVPRIEALIVGYEDLSASLGRPAGSQAGWVHAQETVLVAARAAGLQAIDGPYLEIRDEPGLVRRSEHARDLGYDGKWAVHPDQLQILNEVFTPTRDEFDSATAVMSALEGAGPGAVELDGAMIDEASRKRAAITLARGRAAGLEVPA